MTSDTVRIKQNRTETIKPNSACKKERPQNEPPRTLSGSRHVLLSLKQLLLPSDLTQSDKRKENKTQQNSGHDTGPQEKPSGPGRLHPREVPTCHAACRCALGPAGPLARACRLTGAPQAPPGTSIAATTSVCLGISRSRARRCPARRWPPAVPSLAPAPAWRWVPDCPLLLLWPLPLVPKWPRHVNSVLLPVCTGSASLFLTMHRVLCLLNYLSRGHSYKSNHAIDTEARV